MRRYYNQFPNLKAQKRNKNSTTETFHFLVIVQEQHYQKAQSEAPTTSSSSFIDIGIHAQIEGYTNN